MKNKKYFQDNLEHWRRKREFLSGPFELVVLVLIDIFEFLIDWRYENDDS